VRVFSWRVEGCLEKWSVGANALAVSGSQRSPGRLGALGVERRIGAEAGAWGEKSLWGRPGAQSPVVDAGGVADCVLLGREDRVSCAIGGVGWCLKRVRVSEIAHQVSNSQWFGWRDLSANVVSGPLRSSGGTWCRGVSGGVGFGCGGLWFWGKSLVVGLVCGGVAVWAAWGGANTGFHLTRLAPLGSVEKRALGSVLGRRLYSAAAAQVKPRR
jgi:hypothetical protein